MFHCGLNVGGSKPWCRTNPLSVSYIGADGRVSGGSLWYRSTAFNSDRLHTIRIDCISLAVPLHFDCGCSAVAAGCGFLEHF